MVGMVPFLFVSLALIAAQLVTAEVCDVSVYHPVCGYRGCLRTFFSECIMEMENLGHVDGEYGCP